MAFAPNSVWSISKAQTVTNENEQNLNSDPQIAGFSVRTEGFDFDGTARPKKNTAATHYDKSYSGPATLTSISGVYTRLNQTGHNAKSNDFIKLQIPYSGGIRFANTLVRGTDSSGFNVNLYYESGYFTGVSLVNYQLATGNPNTSMIVVGVNTHSSQDSDRVKINDMKIMKDDNKTQMFRAGLIAYSSVSGVWYNPFNPGVTGNPTHVKWYIPEGFDPETRITGGGYSINGKYTTSDGRKGNYKTTKTYRGKGAPGQ